MNPRPPGYEPGELPDCSTPRRVLQTPNAPADTLANPRTVHYLRFGPVPLRGLLPPRAGNGTRTRDPNLGKVVLYQLSYSREADHLSVPPVPAQRPVHTGLARPKRGYGGEGDRTPDLVNAIHALSQLSYAPAILSRLRTAPRQHGNVAAVGVSVNEGYTAPTQSGAGDFGVIRQP